MTKETLVAQLEAAKGLTSVVSIDNVIALIQSIEDPAPVVIPARREFNADLIERIADEIENALDYNSGELVDKDSAEFSLNYDNRVELDRVEVDVREIMDHVKAKLDLILEAFEAEEQDEIEDAIQAQIESEQAPEEE
jgi:hypothetical protein